MTELRRTPLPDQRDRHPAALATQAAPSDPLTPEVPLRVNALTAALQTRLYCLVTREQSAARASITSTCHPILPGRAVGRRAVVCRRRRLGRNAGWHASAAGRLHARGRPGLAAGRPHRGAVTAQSPPTRCGGRPGAVRGLVLVPARQLHPGRFGGAVDVRTTALDRASRKAVPPCRTRRRRRRNLHGRRTGPARQRLSGFRPRPAAGCRRSWPRRRDSSPVLLQDKQP
jgi:hypothetical protein